MLTVLALVVLFGWVTLAVAVIAWLVDGLERRRLGRVAAEVHVTEAIHGELGPIVAPMVARHRGRGPWTVTMGLGPREVGLAGRLTEIARDTLGRGGVPVRIVFVPRSAP